MNVYQV